jgi:SAM-dependent methyltransferase
VTELYDAIGVNYRRYRQPDPRIARAIDDALGVSSSVVNVGAGSGSYEPGERNVVAVEPSREMIRQRAAGRVPVVQASALDLPFRSEAFATALAVLTVHHWPDPTRGLRELRRVARDRIVILTWDPNFSGFWLVDDYLPEIWAVDRLLFPPLDAFQRVFERITVCPVPIPHDCVDGFLCAYWRRPEAYLDPGVRGAISTFSKIGNLTHGLARLRSDLDDGAWMRRHGHLLTRTEVDLGYRLVVAEKMVADATARADARDGLELWTAD